MQNFEDNILDYIENTLSEVDRYEFERELAQNATLQQEVKAMQMTKNILAQEKRRRELRKEIEMFATKVKAPKKKINFVQIFSIAATVILVLGLGLWFFSSPNSGGNAPYYFNYSPEKAEMSGGKTDINTLLNIYEEEVAKGVFPKTAQIIQQIEPKDSAEKYIYFSIKATMEANLQKYESAVNSLENALLNAQDDEQKLDIAINKVAVLQQKGEKEKAAKEMELLLQSPQANGNQNVQKLKQWLNGGK